MAAVFAMLLVLNPARSYEINPAHDPATIKRTLKTEYRKYLARLSMPTHEELTTRSLDCATGKSSVAGCTLDVREMQGAQL
jgi:hypothetical protein